MSSTILTKNLHSMNESVVQLAEKLGFECQTSSHGSWQIFSVHKCENWQLTQLENKWVLSCGGVPQIYLNDPAEVMTFLEIRYQLISQKGAN